MNVLDQYRREVSRAGSQTEEEALRFLRSKLQLTPIQRQHALQVAKNLVTTCRERPHRRSMLDLFLSEFSLSTKEGIALLCICEALLRIPDTSTADALIADKLGSADWDTHIGHSDSVFLNAATWALMLSGNVIALGEDITRNIGGWLKRLASKLGETAVREAMLQGVQIVGNEFVTGQTIEAALNTATKSSSPFSFDMLGEGARSFEDAARYKRLYLDAITQIGNTKSDNLKIDYSVSVKLSALHPRYAYLQRRQTVPELLTTLKELIRTAASVNIPLTIDAEEASRLDLSMEIIHALAEFMSSNHQLRTWNGFGLAVQAYSLKCFALISWLQQLAHQFDLQFNVRLVKGAYWDTEIKHAQVEALHNYPVFTRKSSTDLSWLVCAEQLFDAPNLRPQIATHNAFSLAAALEIDKSHSFEFQRLHGMGALLYDCAREMMDDFPAVRVYAPVGDHENLLAYLVRRLLENGANTSFVNRFLDDRCSVDEVIQDPVERVDKLDYKPHSGIPLPYQLYGENRPNSEGLDFGDDRRITDLVVALQRCNTSSVAVTPTNSSSLPDLFDQAKSAIQNWQSTSLLQRKKMLFDLADALQAERVTLTKLLQEEAGKTLVDANAEIREAIDFCRYYGLECLRCFQPTELLGPTGERNLLTYSGRGTFVCISPWNFPLAIFLGQITAALAAGNTVIGKPAEQTPRIALYALNLMKHVGFDEHVVQLAFGNGEVGQALIEQDSVAGVAFTGSHATAKRINLVLAQKSGPIIPLIAETGGINVMVADASILFEQAIDDILDSAFRSAGQRCSALRLLCIQEQIFDDFFVALSNAMKTLNVGSPHDPATDVGPIIDAEAWHMLATYLASAAGKVLFQTDLLPEYTTTHIAPCLVQVSSLDDVTDEHFGPILHVMSFKSHERLMLLDQIAKSPYGLTFGVQTRIDRRAVEALEFARSGNMYVNRNMIGATVGVQPFGGHGLSGTGPKAGGPNYLRRFAREHSISTNLVATGGNPQLLNLEE